MASSLRAADSLFRARSWRRASSLFSARVRHGDVAVSDERLDGGVAFSGSPVRRVIPEALFDEKQPLRRVFDDKGLGSGAIHCEGPRFESGARAAEEVFGVSF